MKYKYKIRAMFLTFSFILPINVATPKPKEDTRVERIDTYFAKRGMPLAGYGHNFIEEADKNGIDWRLLPAISVKEQSGGKRTPYNCPGKKINYNWFGWASAKICFKSIDEAIETVSKNLGGNNPKTKSYYKGNTKEKLQSYNGTVERAYPYEVMEIMKNF